MSHEVNMGLVDIHCHILPGVDDGAQTLKDSLELLRMAHEDGVSAVILTPHYRGHYRKNTPEILRRHYEALCAEVRKVLPGMELYLGNEAAWERDLGEKIAEGRVLTMHGSPYVLLEFGFGIMRSQVTDGVMDVVSCGYTPIIAHVERYDIFRKDKTLVDEVLSMGALIQLNADSVLGKRGFGSKRFCHRLLKQGKAHFIASDAHDCQNRPPLLGECFAYVSQRYGEDYAQILLRDNARALLSGQWK
jgi:protein-tyrosine phosphatase